MGFFTKNKNMGSPHVLYPILLHWQKGDIITSIDYGKMESKNFFTAFILRADGLTPMATYIYQSITEDGFVIIEHEETGRLYKIGIKKFLKDAQNISFNNRSIKDDLLDSSRYMELVNEFQIAYNELRESDQPKQLE